MTDIKFLVLRRGRSSEQTLYTTWILARPASLGVQILPMHLWRQRAQTPTRALHLYTVPSHHMPGRHTSTHHTVASQLYPARHGLHHQRHLPQVLRQEDIIPPSPHYITHYITQSLLLSYPLISSHILSRPPVLSNLSSLIANRSSLIAHPSSHARNPPTTK